MTTSLAVSLLAQASPSDLKKVEEAADFLSAKDLKWWFAFVFVLLLMAISFGLWLLLKFHLKHLAEMTTQLTEQRASNGALTEKLLSYIKDDHTKCLQVLTEVGNQMERVAEALARNK